MGVHRGVWALPPQFFRCDRRAIGMGFSFAHDIGGETQVRSAAVPNPQSPCPR